MKVYIKKEPMIYHNASQKAPEIWKLSAFPKFPYVMEVIDISIID